MALMLSRGHGLTSQGAMKGEMRGWLIKLYQETSPEYYPIAAAQGSWMIPEGRLLSEGNSKQREHFISLSKL